MKNYILGLFFIVSIVTGHAQSITISGVVSDKDGSEMPGVNVIVNGTSNGVTTDINGKYSISTENTESLQLDFSFIGYEKQTILVAGRKAINITINEISKSLDEYVVVGYGKTTVKELTGATAKIKGENVCVDK